MNEPVKRYWVKDRVVRDDLSDCLMERNGYLLMIDVTDYYALQQRCEALEQQNKDLLSSRSQAFERLENHLGRANARIMELEQQVATAKAETWREAIEVAE